jgi:hypothetical protein
VNPETGELMFCQNENSPLATAYLQDHKFILFDDNGFILEGSTYFLN